MTDRPDTEPEVPAEAEVTSEHVAEQAPGHAPEKAPGHAPAEDPLRGSFASRAWVALFALGALLVVTVAFVAQNTEPVPLKLFGWTWNPPLAAALLAAAAVGLSVALIAGSLRIVQLRRRVRKGTRS